MAIQDTASIAEELGWILALKNTDPKLQSAWDAYLAGDTAAFESAVRSSDFFTKNNSAARTRQTAKINQTEVYNTDLDRYRLAAKKRLTASGVKIDDATFNSLTQKSYDQGLDDNQLDNLILTSGKILGYGGETQDATSSLKTFAAQYGVSSLLNDAYWDGKSKSLFAGATTQADIEKEIKDLAKSAFPAYADNIDKGVSVLAQTSNIIQTYANVLELDPNTLSLDDPRIRRIAQYTDPATGKPAQMPQWLVEKTAKSDPAWAYTNNARDTLDSLTLKVGKDWGLV
jgi:hypothetical protein